MPVRYRTSDNRYSSNTYEHKNNFYIMLDVLLDIDMLFTVECCLKDAYADKNIHLRNNMFPYGVPKL